MRVPLSATLLSKFRFWTVELLLAAIVNAVNFMMAANRERRPVSVPSFIAANSTTIKLPIWTVSV